MRSSIKEKFNNFSANKDALFLVSIVSVFLTSTILGLSDLDFIWQSYLGKSIITKGDFFGLKDLVWGTVNIHEYYDHEWLCNVFFYLSTLLFGDAYSVIFVKVIIELLLGFTTYAFLKQIIKTYNNLHFISYFCCMLMTYCLCFTLVKPKAYDISLIFFMWLLILLEKRKEGTISFKRFALFILLLTLCWNNIHSGSIVLLVAVTGLYWLIYWRDKYTIFLGVLGLLTLGINPYGYKLIYFDITFIFL